MSSPTKPESLRTMPRMHSRATRSNTPGMLPKAKEQARSKCECNDKKSREVAISESGKLEAKEVTESDWYSQPREEKKSVTKKKATSLRRSKRFTP